MTLQINKIKQMIYEAYPNLSGNARAYVDGLDRLITLFPDNTEDIRQQCNYIYLNLEPEADNKQQDSVKQKMLEISQSRSRQYAVHSYLDEVLVEEDVSDFMMNFEKEPLQKSVKNKRIIFCFIVYFRDFY